MCSSNSGSRLSRILLCWIKLDRLSLPFVGCFMRSCIGWSRSLLYFAACTISLVSRRSSIDCISVIVSMSMTGVLFMAPVIILKAWFCIPDSLLVLDFAAVELAAIPYSRTGRILPTYSFFSILWSAPHWVPDSFFISASLIFALAWFFWSWFFHVSRRSKVTPKYVGVSSACSSRPLSFRLTFCCLLERLKTV